MNSLKYILRGHNIEEFEHPFVFSNTDLQNNSVERRLNQKKKAGKAFDFVWSFAFIIFTIENNEKIKSIKLIFILIVFIYKKGQIIFSNRKKKK